MRSWFGPSPAEAPALISSVESSLLPPGATRVSTLGVQPDGVPRFSRLAVQVLVRLRLVDDSDVASACRRVRELARLHGVPPSDVEALVTAVSEIVRNVIVHAERGELELVVVGEDERAAIVVVVRDDGPGIPDPEAALCDGYSTGRGLGLGLPSARRLVDAFELTSTPGVGTVVTLKKWIRAPR